MASRCATTRSRSSTRRSAAGSPPAPAVTSRRSTPTSTTSSNRCVPSPRKGCGRAAACRARAPGRAPARFRLGGEGVLGVIPEAWGGVEDPPAFKDSAGVLFGDFERGAQAVRGLAQSRLFPTNCRLLDPAEAALTGAAPDGHALLVLGFEGGHDVSSAMAAALE